MGRTALSGASAFTVKAGMRTDLKGFQQTFRHRNAGGLLKLGNHWLSDEETRIFVQNALDAGYRYDTDVPEDLIRKWIGLDIQPRGVLQPDLPQLKGT